MWTIKPQTVVAGIYRIEFKAAGEGGKHTVDVATWDGGCRVRMYFSDAGDVLSIRELTPAGDAPK